MAGIMFPEYRSVCLTYATCFYSGAVCTLPDLLKSLQIIPSIDLNCKFKLQKIKKTIPEHLKYPSMSK